jgi:putative ABC transport system permease protein
MSLLMTVRIAFKALGRNKMRTSLTMLGMIIGVAAVIALVALGTGAQAAIEEQIRGAGTNMVTLFPGAMSMGGVSQGGGTGRLLPEDAEALRRLPEVAHVSEGVQSRQQIIAAGTNWSTNVVGVNVDYQAIKSWPVRYGVFIAEYDVRTTAKVCVLGWNVAENLFGPGVDPTGETIRIRNQLFRVIGVMTPKGASSSGQNQDDQIFAPYTTVIKKLQGREWLNYILLATESGDRVQAMADAVKTEMRYRWNVPEDADDPVRVQTQDDLIAARTAQTQTMTTLLAGIAGVSLLVGGIGIMNIMLVSVTERTREIGLRLAIGARAHDVLSQFLTEAVVISVAGGALGIAAGYGIAELLKLYLRMPALIPADAILMAVGFSAGVGVFFGFYPARKAAGLDPIDALRFE